MKSSGVEGKKRYLGFKFTLQVILLLLALYSGCFYFAQHTFRQCLYGNAAARGLGGEELGVHLIKGGEVCHIGEEAGGFENLFKAAAAGSEHSTDIFAALLGLRGYALRD